MYNQISSLATTCTEAFKAFAKPSLAEGHKYGASNEVLIQY